MGDNLIESSDPLELGQTETISIEAMDYDGINQVLIEIQGVNHSMSYIQDYTWEYDNWIPSSIGQYQYSIFIEDLNNNWNSVSNNIDVVDTTPPIYSDLVESPSLLELGDNISIILNISDLSGIHQVFIEFEGANHSMTNSINNEWFFNSWSPIQTGNHSYTIWMEDNHNNWNSLNDSIQVIDSIAPEHSNLTESADPLELGQTETITVDVTDLSGMEAVYILIKGKWWVMDNIEGNTWEYDSWVPSETGTHEYRIYSLHSD